MYVVQMHNDRRCSANRSCARFPQEIAQNLHRCMNKWLPNAQNELSFFMVVEEYGYEITRSSSPDRRIDFCVQQP